MNKLKITPGEWVRAGDGVFATGNQVAKGVGASDTEAMNNAAFIAEAGTVANETGLMPREMKEQRDELLEACKILVERQTDANGVNMAMAMIRVAIDRADGRAS